MLLLLALPVVLAEPWQDPAATAVDQWARRTGQDLILGAHARSPLSVAYRLQGAENGVAGPWADALLAPEQVAIQGGELTWALRPQVWLAAGDGEPDNHAGDEEPGLLSPRVRLAGGLYRGPIVVRAAPSLGLDLVGAELRAQDLAFFDIDEAWVGVERAGWRLGFGKEDRWVGFGRHGSLLLSDNATPPWMGGGSAEGRLPGWLARIGRFRVEAEIGWMDRPRDDVGHPGVMMMDFRYLPVPLVEFGLTRLTLFGGVDRPPVDVLQLLVPTEPHIYNDPDQLLPDQNEQAKLELRLCLPLAKWGLPIDYVEGWWEYGGEDVIGRKDLGIPYPALAGIANVYGVEAAAGPMTATVEYARLMDDYFRWYVGHRVYHEGFTQDGRPMGYFSGTDSEVLYGALAWQGASARARLWADRTLRVGVIEAQNNKLFTLLTDERSFRVGLEGSLLRTAPSSTLSAGYTIENSTGIDFIPNNRQLSHRVNVGWMMLWGGGRV